MVRSSRVQSTAAQPNTCATRKLLTRATTKETAEKRSAKTYEFRQALEENAKMSGFSKSVVTSQFTKRNASADGLKA